MSVQILEKLFDSPVKVRLLKLFLRNPNEMYSLPEIALRIQINQNMVSKQVKGLLEIEFLRKKKVSRKKGSNKKSGTYFYVNPNFDFYNELRTLVLKSSPASIEKILGQIRRIGNVKLAVLAGVFLNDDNSRIDLFVVGDRIKTKKLTSFLRGLEAEVGKTIDYSVLTTNDFNYRLGMFDRFILDILEKPHQKLINKLRI